METTNNSTCRIEKKPQTFNELIRSGYFWKPFLGVFIGGVAGFLYYRFYECTTAPCSFNSELLTNVGLGSLWGFFIVKRPCSSCR